MLHDVKLWFVLILSTNISQILSQQDELCQRFYYRESKNIYTPSNIRDVVNSICERKLPATCLRTGIVLTVALRSQQETKRYFCSRYEEQTSGLRVKRQERPRIDKNDKKKFSSTEIIRRRKPTTQIPSVFTTSYLPTTEIESSGSSESGVVDDDEDNNINDNNPINNENEASNSTAIGVNEVEINSITAGIAVGIALAVLAIVGIVVVVAILLVWRKIIQGRNKKGEKAVTPVSFKDRASMEESGAYRNNSYAFPDPVSSVSYESMPGYANVPANGSAATNHVYNLGDANYDKLHIYGNADHDYQHLKPTKQNESIEMHDYEQVPYSSKRR